jgi:hypothetical protein
MTLTGSAVCSGSIRRIGADDFSIVTMATAVAPRLSLQVFTFVIGLQLTL